MDEIQWERDMLDKGIDKYLDSIERAKVRVTKDGRRVKTTDEGNTSYGISMIRDIFGDYESCIKHFIETSAAKPGKAPGSIPYLLACDVREVAYIAARAIIDSISRVESRTSVAARIGGHIEDHMRVAVFAVDHPKYYKAVMEAIKERRVNDYRGKRRILIASQNKGDDAAEKPRWIDWPRRDKIRLGVDLISLFVLAGSDYETSDHNWDPELRIPGTGFIEMLTRKTRGGTQYYLAGTEKAAIWIKENMEICAVLHPEFLPMLERPRDWTTPYDGGYYLQAVRERKPLVKSSKKHMELLTNVYMPDVYDAVNAAQQTAWRVNEFVLEQALAEYKAKNGIKMPGLETPDLPECPLPPIEQGDMNDRQYALYRKTIREQLTDDEKREYAEWAEVCREIYNKEADRKAKAIQTGSILRIAAMLQYYEEFFYVHTLDYRGRLYPVGTSLTPQGDGLSKGLLEFAEGTRLGKHGYWHLCIHAAGVFGVDKVSLEERIRWIHKNKREISLTGIDPETTRDFWGSADKPYVFLAACKELSEIWAVNLVDVNNCLQSELEWIGKDYMSHVPAAQDGSCNGIQHFTAMLRDVTGARAVNMTRDPEVNDIYNETADHAIAALKFTLEKGRLLVGKHYEALGAEDAQLINKLLNIIKITRKATKRSTMIIPYGGTKRSCLTHVKDWLVERNAETVDESGAHPFDDKETYRIALILHHYVWDALDTVVVASRKAMGFLRGIVKINNKANEPLTWTTPSGFVAYQDIKSTKEKMVVTQLVGRLQVKYREETDDQNKHKMASTFSPNFVHSLDASHLVLTVVAALDYGIGNYALVHDSFGVPAGQCERFHKIIRQQFVNIYRNNVLVSLLREQQGIFPEYVDQYPDAESVAAGEFNIEEVLNALYFFR